MAFHDLPDDIVQSHILCHLDAVTRIRFSAVCRSWRALSQQGPPCMPCLIFVLHDPTTDSPSLFLFDPISATTHPLPRPKQTKERLQIAGCQGPYLMDSSRNTNTACHLYDPFTGESLQLPTVARNKDGERIIAHIWWSKLCTIITDGSLNLVAVSDQACCPAPVLLWRPSSNGHNTNHADEWMQLPYLEEGIQDMIFHQGNLYCLTGKGVIYAYNVQTSKDQYSRRTIHIDEELQGDWPLYTMNYNFVESCGDLLLVVQRTLREGDRPVPLFKVYKLDEGGPLVLLDHLGDQMLFVANASSSFAMPWMPAMNDFFRKNCIYFVSECEEIYEYPLTCNLARCLYTPEEVPESSSSVELLEHPIVSPYHAWINLRHSRSQLSKYRPAPPLPPCKKILSDHYKVKKCRYYIMTGRGEHCPMGTFCHFAHSESELRDPERSFFLVCDSYENHLKDIKLPQALGVYTDQLPTCYLLPYRDIHHGGVVASVTCHAPHEAWRLIGSRVIKLENKDPLFIVKTYFNTFL